MEDASNELESDRKRKKEDEGEDVGTTKSLKNIRKDCGTAILESGDPLVLAMADAQRAVERAAAICNEMMAGVERRYYAGMMTERHPLPEEASATLEASAAVLSTLVGRIKRLIQGAPIYKLPTELMYKVLGELDMEALFSCEGVCQQWYSLLHNEESKVASDAVWSKAVPSIHGTIAEMDAKWKRLRNIQQIISSLSVKIWQSQSDRKETSTELRLRFMELAIVREFPSSRLVEFRLDGALRGADAEFWRKLFDCLYLKVLHWKSHGRFDGDRVRCWDYSVYNCSDLSRCGLEEFVFDVYTGCVRLKIDTSFVQMLSQVKRLHLVRGLGQSHLLAILRAAEESIEELIFSNLSDDYGWAGEVPKTKASNFIMKQLQKIVLKDSYVGIRSITAPKATYVRFDSLKLVDWTLLDFCRSKLKHLHIETRGAKTGRLKEELFDMPELEELHLDFTIRSELMGGYWQEKEREAVLSYDDYSTAALWKAIGDSNDVTKIQSVLPKLRSLTIAHGPLLDESIVLNYIDIRARLGQPALVEIDICLANHCSNTISSLSTTIPGLQFKLFKDWKSKDTKEWTIKPDGQAVSGSE